MGQFVDDIDRIFHDQTTIFKLNLSFGFILFNNDTEEMQNIDVHEWARQQRPNSKWIVMDFTNATFYVTKLRDHPIGRSVRLPKYVLESPAIMSLDSSKKTGLPYEDKLCFFHCLALVTSSVARKKLLVMLFAEYQAHEAPPWLAPSEKKFKN
jgi:hypothetical protein